MVSPHSAELLSTSLSDLIFFAIKNKRLIRFRYQNCLRIAEPHDYGMMNGTRTVFVYQVGGQSKTKSLPGWKHMKECEIRKLEVLDERFAGQRPAPSGQNKKWDKVFIRVGPVS